MGVAVRDLQDTCSDLFRSGYGTVVFQRVPVRNTPGPPRDHSGNPLTTPRAPPSPKKRNPSASDGRGTLRAAVQDHHCSKSHNTSSRAAIRSSTRVARMVRAVGVVAMHTTQFSNADGTRRNYSLHVRVVASFPARYDAVGSAAVAPMLATLGVDSQGVSEARAKRYPWSLPSPAVHNAAGTLLSRLRNASARQPVSTACIACITA